MKKVVRDSRWPGPASSAQVSHSRAMPVGGPHRENWPALHVPALLLLGQRPFRGPADRCAGVNTWCEHRRSRACAGLSSGAGYGRIST